MNFQLQGPQAAAALCLIIVVIGFSIYGMVHWAQHLQGIMR